MKVRQITKIGDCYFSDPLLTATNKGLVKLIDYIIEQVYDNEIYLLERERDEIIAQNPSLFDTTSSPATDAAFNTAKEKLTIACNSAINAYNNAIEATDLPLQTIDSGSDIFDEALNTAAGVLAKGARYISIISGTAINLAGTIAGAITKNYAATVVGALSTVDSAVNEAIPEIINDIKANNPSNVLSDDNEIKQELDEIDDRIRELNTGKTELLALKVSILPETVYTAETEINVKLNDKLKEQLVNLASNAKAKCNLIVDKMNQQFTVFVDSINKLITNEEDKLIATTTTSGGGGSGSSSLGRPAKPSFDKALAAE